VANGRRGKRAGSYNRNGENRPRIDYAVCAGLKGLPNGHPASYSPVGPADSPTAVVEGASIHNWYAEIDESVETHLVPRKSLERQQMLRIKPQTFEYGDKLAVTTYQTDKVTGQVVKVTDYVPRVTWKSDRSLLRRDKVQQQIGERLGKDITGFKRQTSSSKRIVREQENIDPVDVVNVIDVDLSK
jgi:hypothetical protein